MRTRLPASIAKPALLPSMNHGDGKRQRKRKRQQPRRRIRHQQYHRLSRSRLGEKDVAGVAVGARSQRTKVDDVDEATVVVVVVIVVIAEREGKFA